MWAYDKRKSHVENWKVQYTAKGNSAVKSVNTTSVDVLQKTIGGLSSGQNYTIFVYGMTTGGVVSQDAATLDVTVSTCFQVSITFVAYFISQCSTCFTNYFVSFPNCPRLFYIALGS